MNSQVIDITYPYRIFKKSTQSSNYIIKAKKKRVGGGRSSRLRLSAFTAAGRVSSLVGERRSHMPLGHKKKKKGMYKVMHISACQCWAQAPEEAPACAQTRSARCSLASRALPPRCGSPRPGHNPCFVSKEGRTQYLWLQRSCTAGNPCVFSSGKKSCVFVQETE